MRSFNVLPLVKLLLLLLLLAGGAFPGGVSTAAAQTPSADAPVVETAQGRVQGTTDTSGVHVFKGLPYAAPPVRGLRWKPPQPVDDWAGLRPADRFGPRCMQKRLFGDMRFRSAGVSEDCLYLNVWTPAGARSEAAPDSSARRPVLVYFYGGGFVAGDGSEPRYDGASMARRGIVVVTLNYRLGVFGFLAHPALTEESPHGASGNYGLLDQAQALRWVRGNIRAFGGDPERITIAGESAGSFSVSAHMASPLSKGLISGAIGESGSLLGARAPAPLGEAEQKGAQFARGIEAGTSLADLRALSSSTLLRLASTPDAPSFGVAVDGLFFPRPPAEVYAAGEEARVPLLLGWNSEEGNGRALLQGKAPTPEHFAEAVRALYGADAGEVLRLYVGDTWEDAASGEVLQAATDLAGDRFIGFGTWKWGELHRRTGAPVYRYFYAHPRPPMKPSEGGDAGADPARGAVHSAEIEYALGNLAVNALYEWAPEDYAVSALMQAYFAHFIKTGTPNGTGDSDLPQWPAAGADGPMQVMRLDAEPKAGPAPHRARYLFLDRVIAE